MPVARIKEYLDRNGVRYRQIPHPAAFTAQEEAEASHVPGSAWAKTVVFVHDDEPALAVLPATHHVNPDKLARVAAADLIRLATEKETGRLFPDCDLGAMPPFGHLWDVPVFVDGSLMGNERIAFHAGSHTESIEVSSADFRRLMKARQADFADAGHEASLYAF